MAISLKQSTGVFIDEADDDTFDSLTLPAEPLRDGWQVRWDDEALALRLERFGLTMQNGINGYTVTYFITGLPLTVPPLNYRAVDRPFDDICHLILDLELAEILERSNIGN